MDGGFAFHNGDCSVAVLNARLQSSSLRPIGTSGRAFGTAEVGPWPRVVFPLAGNQPFAAKAKSKYGSGGGDHIEYFEHAHWRELDAFRRAVAFSPLDADHRKQMSLIIPASRCPRSYGRRSRSADRGPRCYCDCIEALVSLLNLWVAAKRLRDRARSCAGSSPFKLLEAVKLPTKASAAMGTRAQSGAANELLTIIPLSAFHRLKWSLTLGGIFPGLHTLPVEDLVDVGADQRLVLVCRHGACSSKRAGMSRRWEGRRPADVT